MNRIEITTTSVIHSTTKYLILFTNYRNSICYLLRQINELIRLSCLFACNHSSLTFYKCKCLWFLQIWRNKRGRKMCYFIDSTVKLYFITPQPTKVIVDCSKYKRFQSWLTSTEKPATKSFENVS